MEDNVNEADKLQEQQEKKVIGIPFQKGYDPRRNYEGRPGQTLKEFQKVEFQKMSDEEKRKFLADINKETRWKMAEGNPATETEHKGELKVQILPSEIIEKNEFQIPPKPIIDSEGQEPL